MAKINHEFDLYEDVFIPPSGYRTEYMEFATYSLSLGFLTIIPALIYAGERYGTEAGNKVFQMIREDAFKKEDYYNRFHIFYDRNAKPIPWSEFDVLKSRYLTFANYLLTKRCTPCSPLTQKEGLFHPKFILIQFANSQDKNEKRYRLIILSRNLTFAHYYETGIVLESTAECVCDNGVGGKISKFIKSYWEATHKSSYKGINLDRLSQTTFTLKTKIETEKPVEINLLFASQLQERALCLKKEINESVFAGGYDSCNVISMNPTQGIIGTNGMNAGYLCNFSDMYEDGANLKGKKADYWYNKYPEKNYSFVIEKSKTKYKKIPVHLHSKLYVFWDSKEKDKWTGLVYAGSANCSINALQGRNEEVLLKMKFDGVQDDASLPTKSINGGASDFDRNHTYCSAEKLKKDEVEVGEICEEEFPILQYKINKENVQVTDLGSDRLEITFEVTNNEDVPINVGFAKRNRTKDVVIGSGETKKITIKITQKSFSDLVVLRKQNENRLYLDSLNLDWQGRAIYEILEDLPIFIPNDLSGFVPSVHGITNTQDNVYEKLAQHRLYCDDFDEILNKSLSAIKEIIDRDKKLQEELGRLKDLDEVSPDEEEIYEDYEDMYQEKHRIDELKAKGLYDLKKAMEALKNGGWENELI